MYGFRVNSDGLLKSERDFRRMAENVRAQKNTFPRPPDPYYRPTLEDEQAGVEPRQGIMVEGLNSRRPDPDNAHPRVAGAEKLLERQKKKLIAQGHMRPESDEDWASNRVRHDTGIVHGEAAERPYHKDPDEDEDHYAFNANSEKYRVRHGGIFPGSSPTDESGHVRRDSPVETRVSDDDPLGSVSRSPHEIQGKHRTTADEYVKNRPSKKQINYLMDRARKRLTYEEGDANLSEKEKAAVEDLRTGKRTGWNHFLNHTSGREEDTEMSDHEKADRAAGPVPDSTVYMREHKEYGPFFTRDQEEIAHRRALRDDNLRRTKEYLKRPKKFDEEVA